MGKIIPFPELRHVATAAGPESYLAPIDRAKTEYPPFNGRILGCRVLLCRIEENITHSGRFLLPDTYQHGSVMYRVLAVGPGEWVKIGRKRVFIQAEVEPGDCVVSRHWTGAQDPRNAMWHQPEYIDDVGGAGRVIVDARFCEFFWSKSGNSKPLGNRIIAKTFKEKGVINSTIIIPDCAKEKSNKYTVVDIGCTGSEIQKGDCVLTEGSRTEIKLFGNELFIINIDDILAVIT